MRYGSVCSGIEAATCAWHPLGWTPAFFADIDKFPSRVLAHHYPLVPNLGDFTKIGQEHGPIDLLVGGTPCQSFSVAGLRGGLADSRGNLALEFLRLADRLRARWLVWENVPGVLSSGDGRDFGSILGGMAELGYGFAYRVLDAQHFGVPQRRRRVFVVGYLGDWRPPAAVLFERASLRGDPPPSRTQGQEVAGSLGGGAGTRGWCDDLDRAGAFIPEVSPALKARDYKGPSSDGDSDGAPLIAHSLRAEGFDASEDGTGRGTPLTVVPILEATGRQGVSTDCGLGIGDPGDPMFTLQSGKQHAVAVALRGRDGGATAELGDERANALRGAGGGGDKAHVLAFGAVQVTSRANRSNPQPGDPSHPLAAGPPPTIAFQSRASHTNSMNPSEIAPSLGVGKAGGVATQTGARVRRLTPTECERLQGFPDGYTAIPGAADGPRYRALGNSMAVPVMRWLGGRVAFVDALCRSLSDTHRAGKVLGT